MGVECAIDVSFGVASTITGCTTAGAEVDLVTAGTVCVAATAVDTANKTRE